MKKILAALFLIVTAALVAFGQQPQTQTAPIFDVNSKYANGVAPGYAPTPGSGMTLNISAGTVNCPSGSILVYTEYAGGTKSMTISTTNYVYLDLLSSCAPGTNTSGFTSSTIPIAVVTTSGSAITSIKDARTPFGGSGSGGGGGGSYTTGYIPIATSATLLGNSTCDEGISTANTLTCGDTAGAAFQGKVAVAADGTHAGDVQWNGNTANPTLANNTFNILGPSSATFTKWGIQYESTGPGSACIPHLAALSSSVSQHTCSLVDLAADVTGTLPNANIMNPSTTVNGQTCTLGSSCTISAGGGGTGFAWGGSGTDGAITADGSTPYGCLGAAGTNHGVSSSYQQVYDCNATTFVLNVGVTIFENGNRIFGTQSIEITGTLRNNGANGGTGGNGAGAGTAGSAGTSASASEDQTVFGNNPTGCLWITTAASCGGSSVNLPGVIGGAGTSTTGGNGTLGVIGSIPNFDICPANGVAGTDGGAGGNGAGPHLAGTKGSGRPSLTCTANAPAAYAVLQLPYILMWTAPTPTAINLIGYVPTRGGSGSGGAGGGDGTVSGGGGGGSGAPGGEGNIIELCAPTITIDSSGIVSADGGNGGNGGNGGSPSSGTGPGGGGGGAGGDGGDGGVITIVAHTYTNNGSVHANGGTKGTKGTHGTHFGSGSDGSDGNDGNNGQAGYVIQIPL